MLIDGVEFDSGAFSKMATDLQEAGCPPVKIRQILEEVGARVLCAPTVDDSDSGSASNYNYQTSDGDHDGNANDCAYDTQYPDDSASSGRESDYEDISGNDYEDNSDDDYDYATDWFELTREDMIQILRGMKINIPRETKLHIHLLESGLTDALKSAQSNVGFPVVFTPNTLPLWNQEKSVAEVFNMLHQEIPWEGAARRVYDNLSAFLELVEKDGIDCIISVRTSDNRPLIHVAYSVVNRINKTSLERRVSKLFDTEKGHTEMALTITEQRLLEIYLEGNQLYSSSDYALPEELDEDDEYMFSFILPLSPISGKDLEWICQRTKCSAVTCQKTLTTGAFPYVYSDAQYCSQACENKCAEIHLRLNKKEKAGKDPSNPMFFPNGQFNISYELEEAYFENGYVDPEEELQRHDVIHILRGMKVNILPWTKFSASMLEARLKLALDAAQRHSDLFQGAARVELDQFPKWEEKKGSRLLKAFDVPERSFPVKIEDKREMVMSSVCNLLSRFVKRVEAEGVDTVTFIDAKNFRALVVKIVGIYAIKDQTPLLATAYKVIHGYSQQEDLWEVRSEKGPRGITSIPMPQIEQRLLEFYLEHNQDRLLVNRTIPESIILKVNRLTRDGYDFGFILPPGDILPKELGILNEFEGCELCGEKVKTRCMACGVIWYCGQACQANDQNKHESFCQSVVSGTWHTIRLSPGPMTSTTSASKPMEHPAIDSYPDKYSLLKLHRPAKSKRSKQAMLVHDVAKSFTLYFSKEGNRKVFDSAMNALDGNADRKMMYRWVKRVSEWEWSVCLECVPEIRPTW